MFQSDKQWWAPLWKGLVMDSTGQHYLRMKSAIWLYLYLLLNADRKTGYLVRKISTICIDMRISRDTVSRWLKVLRNGGYISTHNTGHCLAIQITKWRSREVGQIPHQKLDSSNTRSRIHPTPVQSFKHQISASVSQESRGSPAPNDTILKKTLLTRYIDSNNLNHSSMKKSINDQPLTRAELLAHDLATALDDTQGLSFYLSCAKKYPESLLWRVLGEVKEYPPEQIKKSKGALFNYLVHKYAHQPQDDSGN